MLGELKMRPKVPFDHGYKNYYLGLLYALLGEKELATNLLKDAYAEGKGFGWEWYDDDFRLFTLFDYPRFQEFVKPKASPE